MEKVENIEKNQAELKRKVAAQNLQFEINNRKINEMN